MRKIKHVVGLTDRWENKNKKLILERQEIYDNSENE